MENECISHNFSLFDIILQKNYKNWWKFDDVLQYFFLRRGVLMYKTICNISMVGEGKCPPSPMPAGAHGAGQMAGCFAHRM